MRLINALYCLMWATLGLHNSTHTEKKQEFKCKSSAIWSRVRPFQSSRNQLRNHYKLWKPSGSHQSQVIRRRHLISTPNSSLLSIGPKHKQIINKKMLHLVRITNLFRITNVFFNQSIRFITKSSKDKEVKKQFSVTMKIQKASCESLPHSETGWCYRSRTVILTQQLM